MQQSVTDKKIIGRVEEVSFPGLKTKGLHARVDTGAQTSSVWASKVVEKNDRLVVVFFGPESPLYTGKKFRFYDYSVVMVASSNGQAEPRYKVRLSFKVAGKKIRAHFTLADRSTQVYPVLIGRNILRGKFIVDVKHGQAQIHAERKRSNELQSRLPNA